MTTLTRPVPTRVVPSLFEQVVLAVSDRLSSFAAARMLDRASGVDAAIETERAAADERRRTAASMGALGLMPRR